MSEAAERLHDLLPRVRELLARGETAALRRYLGTLHPSDVADVIEDLEDEERMRLLEALPVDLVSEALAEMEEVEKPADLLVRLPPDRVAAIIGQLADDDAADLIGELEPEDRERVLAAIPEAAEIEELLHYPEETAGGIMTTELVAVPSHLTAGQALDEVRGQAAEAGDFYAIFVIDANRRLRGVVSLPDLVLADPTLPILQITQDPVAVVPVDMDQEEVGRILSRYNLVSIGVVDVEGRLVGRVTFDDVIDVIEAETTEDILRFAAVSDEEEVLGGTRDAVRSRLPWLVLNLFTAAAAASVVYLFRDTIERLVVLAAVMPIIAGMGGNAGTQTLAVTVRRIALERETLGERWRVIAKELVVGLVNGLVIGAITAVAGLLLPEVTPVFGLVVLLAMWGNLIVASLAGAFFPILLESLGADPAVASSIFVTTMTDLCGFFLLLGLASTLLV